MATHKDIYPNADGGIPDWFVGSVAKKVGDLLVPDPSIDVHEAGHRFDALEQYSEPLVDIGEIANQEELLALFADKPYLTSLHFVAEMRDGVLKVRHCVIPGVSDIVIIKEKYTKDELTKLTGLIMPTLEAMITDFDEFRGGAMPAHSLIDQLNDRQEIDYMFRDWHETKAPAEPRILLIVRGGLFSNRMMGNRVEQFDFHQDGIRETGGSVNYIGSVTERGEPSLDTFSVVGVSEGKSDLFVNRMAGLAAKGGETVHTDGGCIYRAGASLDQIYHSIPPEPERPTVRVFFRAEAQYKEEFREIAFLDDQL